MRIMVGKKDLGEIFMVERDPQNELRMAVEFGSDSRSEVELLGSKFKL
jgi:hypothetical protein